MLIVDDSKLTRLMIKKFANESYPELQFLEAANADEALERSQGQSIDIMTIDYNMPGDNGLDLAEKLKETHPNARISLLTANVQDAIQKRTSNLGIEFIPKPVDENKIVNFLKAS